MERRSLSRHLTAKIRMFWAFGSWYFELLIFAIVAVAATWPLACHYDTALPMGTERAATVPLFNLWTIWWNAESAVHGFRGYWDAPIFFPSVDSFAFSETQLPTLIVAPVVRLASTPVPAYNLYLLGSLVANGWMARWLLRRIGIGGPAAFFGGLMVIVLPFVHWQLGVLQLVPLWGLLWTLGELWEFGENPRVRTGLSVGAAFAVTYLTCNHYGLFLSVLLVPSGALFLGRRVCEWSSWKRLLPGAALCLALMAPLVVVQLRVLNGPDWKRKPDVMSRLSAESRDYSAAPWPQLVPVPEFAAEHRRKSWPLSAGYLKWLLSAVGIVGGLSVRRYRRWTAACALILVAAFLLSLGPKLQLYGVSPYEWLVEGYPGFAQVRSVFRFAVFVQLMIALLAALGIRLAADLLAGYKLGSQTASVTRPRWRIAITFVLVATVAGCAVIEVWPARQKLIEVPSLETNEAWTRWIRENTQPEDVVAFVPFPREGDAMAYEETTKWMSLQPFYGLAMVNGYSGFFPERFHELKSAMQEFPDDKSIAVLYALKVRYCVVRSSTSETGHPRSPLTDSRLRRVFVDERAGLTIYRLERRVAGPGANRTP
jgi:hypothetical protein